MRTLQPPGIRATLHSSQPMPPLQLPLQQRQQQLQLRARELAVVAQTPCTICVHGRAMSLSRPTRLELILVVATTSLAKL